MKTFKEPVGSNQISPVLGEVGADPLCKFNEAPVVFEPVSKQGTLY